MPYIPPHLRPGYVPSKPVVLASGKIRWPSTDDIVQPFKLHTPPKIDSVSLGINKRRKSALKLVTPITPNAEPVARPSMAIRKLPPKFQNTLRLHLKTRSKKGKKAAKKTQRRRAKKQAMLSLKRGTRRSNK